MRAPNGRIIIVLTNTKCSNAIIAKQRMGALAKWYPDLKVFH